MAAILIKLLLLNGLILTAASADEGDLKAHFKSKVKEMRESVAKRNNFEVFIKLDPASVKEGHGSNIWLYYDLKEQKFVVKNEVLHFKRRFFSGPARWAYVRDDKREFITGEHVEDKKSYPLYFIKTGVRRHKDADKSSLLSGNQEMLDWTVRNLIDPSSFLGHLARKVTSVTKLERLDSRLATMEAWDNKIKYNLDYNYHSMEIRQLVVTYPKQKYKMTFSWDVEKASEHDVAVEISDDYTEVFSQVDIEIAKDVVLPNNHKAPVSISLSNTEDKQVSLEELLKDQGVAVLQFVQVSHPFDQRVEYMANTLEHPGLSGVSHIVVAVDALVPAVRSEKKSIGDSAMRGKLITFAKETLKNWKKSGLFRRTQLFWTKDQKAKSYFGSGHLTPPLTVVVAGKGENQLVYTTFPGLNAFPFAPNYKDKELFIFQLKQIMTKAKVRPNSQSE